MPLEYVKLANVTVGGLTKAEVLALMDAEELIVVNLKGRMLTETQVENHLDGRVDGEMVVRT